ncbi:hypothetical protein LQ564_10515 [Massilia sp. G4R7]|uniref:Uncharacterized protein n=1 Tax=Massilia phyllostachyos TaxID=2898585 RepID=A0ABS8Q804_9BURK|nr:hypothetical protein [Massilia phyllostachyos]MCD2516740.1 hypothetical protein [Massilia phyllostachyos]
MSLHNEIGPDMRAPRLARADLLAQAVALSSSGVGGYVLESVVLVACAAHHLAGIGFRMLIGAAWQERPQPVQRARAFTAVQVVIWACCLLLAVGVVPMGAHSIFHADSLASLQVAVYALPGVAAAVTSALLVRPARQAGLKHSGVDAWLAAVPSALAFAVAFSGPQAQAGTIDAAVGVAIVLLLPLRALLHLGRLLN